VFARYLIELCVYVCAESTTPQAAAPCNATALRLAAATTDLPRNLSIKTMMPLPEISRGFAASGVAGVATGGAHASKGEEPRPQSEPAWQLGEDDAFWEEGTVMELSSYGGEECSTPHPGQCKDKQQVTKNAPNTRK